MDAKLIDNRDGSEVCRYLDWYWAYHSEVQKNPDRFGCHRAQAAADNMNESEAYERFVVEPLLPRIGQAVKVRAYSQLRDGRVTEIRLGKRKRRAEIRVRWYSKNGTEHNHWYSQYDLRFAHNSGSVRHLA